MIFHVLDTLVRERKIIQRFFMILLFFAGFSCMIIQPS